MKRIFFIIFSIIFLFSINAMATTGVANQLSYQGQLQNTAGEPVADGTYTITFTLYDEDAGSIVVWSETQNVTITQGAFSVVLGSVTPIDITKIGPNVTLGIKVGSDTEMTPRQKIYAVLNALKSDSAKKADSATTSDNANKLQGKAASDFALSTHNHNASEINTISATNLVSKIIAGSGITISPTVGTGDVTISVVPAGGGVQLQTTTPGTQQTGNINISGGIIAGALQTSTINGLINIYADSSSADTVVNITNNDTTYKANLNVEGGIRTSGVSSNSINTAETTTNTIGTAGKTIFFGDGSNLTGVLKPGANIIGSNEIIDGSITLSDIDLTGLQNTMQKKLSGNCAGQVAVGIDTNGAFICEPDDTTGGVAPNSITTTEITDGTITNTDISPTAAIAYSKLNLAGAITNADISATANISKSKLNLTGSISLSDIANNGCAVGQVMKYNGSVWVCDADLTGGGGGIVPNPAATQTIQGTTAAVTPLVLQGQSAQSASMFEVKDFSNISLLKVAPTGNLLIGNPSQISPKLSVEDASVNPAIAIKHVGSGTALDVWQAGSGMGAVVSITSATNTNPLYDGDTSGTGNLLQLSVGGISKFVVNNAGNITVGGASDPNAVKINPAAKQTITASSAGITPLEIKAAASPTADIFNVSDSANTSLVKVNTTGNLLVGNPGTTIAKVSVEETGTTNNGGYFYVNNAANAYSAVGGYTTGTGKAGIFQIINATNSNPAVYGTTNGTGNAVYGYTTSTGGKGGYFEIDNAGNANSAVYGFTIGTGNAGNFQISNASNSNPVVLATTNGTGVLFKGNTTGAGNLLQIQQNSVDKFVVDNAGNITVGGSANSVKNNPSANQTIQPSADVVPLIIKDDAGAVANLFDVQNNAGASLVTVDKDGSMKILGNAPVSGFKLWVENTATTGDAGIFKINNASNNAYAIGAYTNGTGNVIATNNSGTGDNLWINTTNGTNAAAVIKANTAGTGNLLQLQQGAVNKFVVDNTGNITAVGTNLVTNLNADKLDGYDSTAFMLATATVFAGLGTINTATTPTALLQLNQNGGAGGLLQLQNSGVDKFVVSNTGNITMVGTNLVTNLNADKLDGYDSTAFALATGTVINTPTTGIGNAGYFRITNASNTYSAVMGVTNGTGASVEGYTNGTGAGGYFQIGNISNTSPILLGDTGGTGNLLQLQKGAVDKFVVDNAGNITMAGTNLVTNLNADKVDGFDATGLAKLATMNTANTPTALLQLNQNGGAGGLLQLQNSGVNKFVVDNTGNILLDGNANPSIKASGATPNIILDADGTGASIVKVKNTTSPGSVTLQVEGSINISGTNSVPVTAGVTQQLIQSGRTCEATVGTGYVNITFPVAFSSAPNIVGIIDSDGSGGTIVLSVRLADPATDISSTFARLTFNSNNVSFIECVQWIAIGNK